MGTTEAAHQEAVLMWRERARKAGAGLNPRQRAELVRALVTGVYDVLRHDEPQDDERERTALGKVLDAAEDHFHAELKREQGR